jgi:hypothetical protein
MVKMYSTRRPAAERTCLAQRAAFMLTVLVLTVLLSMRRFLLSSASSSRLGLEQQGATMTFKEAAGDAADSSSYNSNTLATSDRSHKNDAEEDAAAQEVDTSTSISSSSSSSLSSSIIQSKNFPSFVDNGGGGVVIFYHASSRTGGLTIRQNFANRPPEDGIKYVKLGHSTQAMNMADKIIRHILNRKNIMKNAAVAVAANADGVGGGGIEAPAAAVRRPETFVMEIPGELTTLIQLSKLLEQWRILAVEHGASFFAFTLIRDPVPFHVSFFNTHMAPHMEPTVENLLQSMPRNEQCRRLVQNNDNDSIVDILEEEGQESSSSSTRTTECEQAYDWMRSGLDWIGTTEKLNHETLPILSHLLLQNASIGQSMPRFVARQQITIGGEAEDTNPDNNNNNNNKLLVEDLSPEDVARIRELSNMDQKLYQNVLQDFSIDIMEDSNNNE